MKPLLIAILSIFVSPAQGQEMVTLAARAGATQSYLLIAPKDTPPQAAAVLFPGGVGNIRLRTEGGEIRFSPNNFLVRARDLFAAGGVAVAIVDAPSDQAQGMANSFRKSEPHIQDIRAVVADLKKRYAGAPVFLVGTSMGTVSAAYAGRALGGEVTGVALTSSVFVPSGRRSTHGDSNLSDFSFAAIKAPLLFVHHHQDGCQITPYAEARRQADRYPLISVSGGQPPQSDPCEALSAHGYLGKEPETVEAIVNWMLKKPYRKEIE
jgi:alpha-beta hydrolase superfamily lysophospholipase